MEAKSIATQPSNSLPPSQRGIEILPAPNAAFLIIISLLMLSAIAAAIYDGIFKHKLQHSFGFKPRHQVPCHRCRYFSGNPYVKCALYPVTVLTEQAGDCADYYPNNKAKRVEE